MSNHTETPGVKVVDRMTPQAQLSYHLLARIESVCKDLNETPPEDIGRYNRRLWLVLVVLDCIGKTVFVGWRSHIWELVRRGSTPNNVAHRF